ncbi:MAG TPA: PilZ domain-containing protein [Thermoanaerobaculia bacterium]|nr:PilZ domain-containing protein [Thermoanaerobaculia bacterium]
MLLPTDVTLRRDQLSELLGLSPKVVDALIASRTIETTRRDGKEVVPCAQLERVFRDSLLRLYQAQAAQAVTTRRVMPERELELELDSEEAVPEEASVDEPLPAITRTSDEHLVVPPVEDADLRLGARYIPRRQLGGMFRDVKMTVLQMSNSGLRIRHSEQLQPGEEARFSFAIQNPPRSFVMRARVVWTSIAQRGEGPSFFISGLRVTANADRLVESIESLRNARELHLDESRRRNNVPMPVVGLPDEDVVAIIRAVRRFAADPTEATRWYTRARFAVAEEEVRRAAPRGARDRQEAIGVWEYLQRRIDLRAVAGVVAWIRSSQVAGV